MVMLAPLHATRCEFDMARRVFTTLSIAITAMAAFVAESAAAHAQDAGGITVEIGDCVDLESAEERRDCYAARVDAAVQERERSAAAATPASRSSSSDEEAVRPQDATRADSQRLQIEVVATITELRETVPNSYLITLDNDQVWRQKEPKWFPLRVGQAVRIFPSSWGNTFRLSVQGLSGYIQVERAR
jgi:hypothetical protein